MGEHLTDREACTVLSTLEPRLPPGPGSRQSHDLRSPAHAMLPWGLLSGSAPMEQGAFLHASFVGSGCRVGGCTAM